MLPMLTEKTSRIRHAIGCALVMALAYHTSLRAFDEWLVITIVECKPENWHLWVGWFGEDLAGYMRWLYCAMYGLP